MSIHRKTSNVIIRIILTYFSNIDMIIMFHYSHFSRLFQCLYAFLVFLTADAVHVSFSISQSPFKTTPSIDW